MRRFSLFLTIFFLTFMSGEVLAVGSANIDETTSRDFVLNAGDEAGDVALSFGSTLGEYLQWSSANSRFEISDDFRVEGNLATVGQNFTAADHSLSDSDGVLNIGRNANTWETLTFDATTDDRFEFSDDLEVQGNLDVSGDINSACGPYGIFSTERGSIASNQSWSIGNGQTPWGHPMGCAGTVTRFAATCTGSIGTSLGAEIRKNNVSTSCSLSLSTTVGQVTVTSCSETFLGTDVVGVYAQTETGNWTECVGTFWVRYD